MAIDDWVVRQNSWWMDPDGWERGDPHLRRLAEQPALLPADAPSAVDLARPGIHTLRGPRQVGKSTSLKLLVKRALAEGKPPRSVVYLALDLLEDRPIRELARTIESAFRLAGGEPPRLLLLDEVTAVATWQTAVKFLWDAGTIDRDVVVCTGSSALDLAAGTADRMPGRRGAGKDHLVLPQTFAAFARAVDPAIPASPGLSLGQLNEPEGRAMLEQARIHQPRLQQVLDLFLLFGGLPAAVAEALTGGDSPSEPLRRVVWDSLDRELRRKRASWPSLHAVLERVLRSLGSRTNWSRMASEAGLPETAGSTDHRTLREYVEVLASAYFLLVVYFWRPESDANAVSRDKKVYAGDPLILAVGREHAPGLGRNVPAEVENAFAVALHRRYEPEEGRREGYLAPTRLHVWATARGGEIDFVCGPRDRLDVLEVKYRSKIDRRSAAGTARAFPGRPCFIATKDDFELRPDCSLVPSALLLWALGA